MMVVIVTGASHWQRRGLTTLSWYEEPDSIVDAVNLPDRIRRVPPAISQFCDSHAEKSVNFLYW